MYTRVVLGAELLSENTNCSVEHVLLAIFFQISTKRKAGVYKFNTYLGMTSNN
jgi:hypothetical protein